MVTWRSGRCGKGKTWSLWQPEAAADDSLRRPHRSSGRPRPGSPPAGPEGGEGCRTPGGRREGLCWNKPRHQTKWFCFLVVDLCEYISGGQEWLVGLPWWGRGGWCDISPCWSVRHAAGWPPNSPGFCCDFETTSPDWNTKHTQQEWKLTD